MIKDNPIMKSIIWTLAILVFPVSSGVIATVLKINDIRTMFLQGCFMLISLIIPLVYLIKFKISFKKIQFRKIENGSVKKVLFFLPLIIAEIPFLVIGVDLVSIKYIITLLFFRIAIGISEETYFRGIIFKLVREKYPIKKSVIISALVFGIGHLTTAFVSKSIVIVVLSILNAVIFGIIASEIVIITESLIPVIIWHSAFDFVNSITLAAGTNLIFVSVFQEIIMIIYAYNLWSKISLNNKT